MDFAGTLVYDDKNEPVINFGKHKGKRARDVFKNEPNYFKWIQQSSFTLETKAQFARLEQDYTRETLMSADKFNVRPFKTENHR